MDRKKMIELAEDLKEKALELGYDKKLIEEEFYYKTLMLEECDDRTIINYTNAIMFGSQEKLDEIIPVVEEEIGTELPEWLKTLNETWRDGKLIKSIMENKDDS